MNKKIISVVSIILVIAIMCTVLAACNAESIEKKLKKADFSAEALTAEDVEKYVGKDAEIKWAVGGTKGTDTVIVIAFAKTDDAKAAESDLQKAADFENKLGGSIMVKRSMKVVYFGTEAGIKAAK